VFLTQSRRHSHGGALNVRDPAQAASNKLDACLIVVSLAEIGISS
jgi:hypothetical protein